MKLGLIFGLIFDLVSMPMIGGCTTNAQVPTQDSGSDACQVDPAYAIWLKEAACCKANKRITVIDPCGPGTVTFGCGSDAGACERIGGNGP
jgi:hypothetical protein